MANTKFGSMKQALIQSMSRKFAKTFQREFQTDETIEKQLEDPKIVIETKINKHAITSEHWGTSIPAMGSIAAMQAEANFQLRAVLEYAQANAAYVTTASGMVMREKEFERMMRLAIEGEFIGGGLIKGPTQFDLRADAARQRLMKQQEEWQRQVEVLSYRRQRKERMAELGITLAQSYSFSEEGEQIMSGNFWDNDGSFTGSQQEIMKDWPKVLVLVDGDIIAYRASAAADGRFYQVDTPVAGQEKSITKSERFKYSNDAKAYCDKRSIPNSAITQGFEPEPVENALHSVASAIENIKNFFISEKKMVPILKVCLSCKRNFRYEVFPDYKKSRINVRRPEHLDACKDYLVTHFSGHRYDPFEADDLIAMMVEEIFQIPAEQRKYVVIASIDKDFTQLGREGLEFYDFTNNKMWSVTENEAMLYFYKQILMGDSSDDIPGLPKVGPQTAIKILTKEQNPGNFEYGLYLSTLEAYMKILGLEMQEARQRIVLAATLLKLVRDEDEVGHFWQPPELTDKQVADSF